MRKLLTLLLLSAVAGCGGSKPTGNELGGVMSWSGQSPESAFKAADAHCRKANKAARIAFAPSSAVRLHQQAIGQTLQGLHPAMSDSSKRS